MPLIQVDLDRQLYDAAGEDIKQAIHEAQIDALGIPADDLFQVFNPHDPGEVKFDRHFNSVDRRSLVLIRITAVHMYSPDTKQQLYRSVVDRLKQVGIRPEDVLIALTENGFEDWYAGRLDD